MSVIFTFATFVIGYLPVFRGRKGKHGFHQVVQHFACTLLSPLILKYLSRLERGTKIPEANNGHPCALLSSNSECVQQRALNCFHPLGSRPKWM